MPRSQPADRPSRSFPSPRPRAKVAVGKPRAPGPRSRSARTVLRPPRRRQGLRDAPRPPSPHSGTLVRAVAGRPYALAGGGPAPERATPDLGLLGPPRGRQRDGAAAG